ncbi:MAG: hypothetical protein ABFC63_01335 [Thermoguttaceae bacterium]
MKIVIDRFREDQADAVRQFNRRLAAGGQRMAFPTSPTPDWLPKIPGRTLYQEHFIASDLQGAVRGAYTLKHQEFWINDRAVSIADLQLPISEGVVDRRYSMVAVLLLRDALARQPLLFGLGMGGFHEPVVKLLKAAGWNMFSVPFFFRVLQPSAFLRNLTYLRRGPASASLFDALAWTGLGNLGIRAVQAFHRRLRPGPTTDIEVVDDFTDWISALWQECRDQYGMTAVRTADVMQALYPKHYRRFIRLKVSRDKRPIGFAVLLNTQLENHNYFGNMRLGTIVSCFGQTADAATVVAAAASYLETHGADLIVSNHSHIAWRHAFRRAGFLRGPSNMIFATSKALTKTLDDAGIEKDDLHLNRGDGDGPINL